VPAQLFRGAFAQGQAAHGHVGQRHHPLPQRARKHRNRDRTHAGFRPRAGDRLYRRQFIDGTYEECLRVQEAYAGQHDIKVLRQDGKGKGDAVRKACASASGDILMILDADLTMPPEALPKFYNAIVSGKAEMINGSRLVYPMEDEAMRPLNFIANRFFARVFSYLVISASPTPCAGPRR
jgi:hypothetical protein